MRFLIIFFCFFKNQTEIKNKLNQKSDAHLKLDPSVLPAKCCSLGLGQPMELFLVVMLSFSSLWLQSFVCADYVNKSFPIFKKKKKRFSKFFFFFVTQFSKFKTLSGILKLSLNFQYYTCVYLCQIKAKHAHICYVHHFSRNVIKNIILKNRRHRFIHPFGNKHQFCNATFHIGIWHAYLQKKIRFKVNSP